MQTDVFELEIIQPSSSKRLSIFWVEVESPTGNFVVGPEHLPLVSILKKRGKLTYQLYNGSKVSIDIYGGIFKVANNKAIVILDQ